MVVWLPSGEINQTSEGSSLDQTGWFGEEVADSGAVKREDRAWWPQRKPA